MSSDAQGLAVIISFLIMLYTPITIIAFRNTRNMQRPCRFAFSLSVFPVFTVLLVFSIITAHHALPNLVRLHHDVSESTGSGSPASAIMGGALVLPLSLGGTFLWHRLFLRMGRQNNKDPLE